MPSRRHQQTEGSIERDAEAWEMRVARLTYRQIGAHFGVTRQRAQQTAVRHAKSIPAELVEDITVAHLGLPDYMSRTPRAVAGRKHFAFSHGGRLLCGPDGQPVTDDGPTIAVEAVRAKIIGIYAPTRSSVVITQHDVDAVTADTLANLAQYEQADIDAAIEDLRRELADYGHEGS